MVSTMRLPKTRAEVLELISHCRGVCVCPCPQWGRRDRSQDEWLVLLLQCLEVSGQISLKIYLSHEKRRRNDFKSLVLKEQNRTSANEHLYHLKNWIYKVISIFNTVEESLDCKIIRETIWNQQR